MNHNEPAYPINELDQRDSSRVVAQHFGMTIRMAYAMSALTGLLANASQDYAPLVDDKRKAIVDEAWRLADMMVERGKGGPQ